MSITNMSDPRNRLRALLLERPDYAQAYTNYPEFRIVVDGMINTIPLILRMAHEDALKVAEHKKIAKRDIERGWTTARQQFGIPR